MNLATTSATIPQVIPQARTDLELEIGQSPRRYWYRAYQRAVARCRRLSATYEHAWRQGQPAMQEWEQLVVAHRREAFTYRMLCCVMGWR